MTVLVGGMRVLGANHGGQARRVHRQARTLTNDFFVNLLDMGTEWKPRPTNEDGLRGPRPQATGEDQVDRHPRRPRVRLQLAAARPRRGLRLRRREEKFVQDFVAAWDKVMNLDRFECPD
jgi:catalase-peroxidase